MEIVKVSASLGFEEALRPWLELRSMIRWAQARDDGEIQGQAVVSLSEDARQRVTIQVRAFAVEQERRQESSPTMRQVVDKLAQFPELGALGTLATIRFDAQYIDPLDLPFHEVNTRIKDAFLAQHDLTTAATDVQLVLDEAVDESTTNHHQLGPMAPAQLNTQLLAFRRDDLPDQFIFLSLGRTLKGSQQYSVDRIAEQGSTFSEWAAVRAQKIVDRIRR